MGGAGGMWRHDALSASEASRRQRGLGVAIAAAAASVVGTSAPSAFALLPK